MSELRRREGLAFSSSASRVFSESQGGHLHFGALFSKICHCPSIQNTQPPPHTFSAQKIGIRPSGTGPIFTCFLRANFNF